MLAQRPYSHTIQYISRISNYERKGSTPRLSSSCSSTAQTQSQAFFLKNEKRAKVLMEERKYQICSIAKGAGNKGKMQSAPTFCLAATPVAIHAPTSHLANMFYWKNRLALSAEPLVHISLTWCQGRMSNKNQQTNKTSFFEIYIKKKDGWTHEERPLRQRVVAAPAAPYWIMTRRCQSP